jgi:hypothetical protein
MNKRTIDEFRMQAKSVSLPDDVRNSVLAAARGGRDSEHGVPSTTSSHMHFEHKMAGHALAVAACVVVALVVTAFSGISGLPWSTGGPGATGSDATGNSFELKAYAEGIPQGDETLLALDDFNCGSLSGGDDGMWEESHDFNLTCTGDNIASVSYALEGPHVIEPDTSVTTPGILFKNERNDQEGPGIVSYSSTSFSVNYDAQSTSEQGFQRHLVVDFAETDEMKAIDDQLDALTASSDPSSATADDVRQQESLWSQLEYLSEKQCAQVLSETTFVMTVTFDDGTTQTKSYAIAPVADFDEKYSEYASQLLDLEAAADENPDDATAKEQLQEFFAKRPLLYSIAEVSN